VFHRGGNRWRRQQTSGEKRRGRSRSVAVSDRNRKKRGGVQNALGDDRGRHPADGAQGIASVSDGEEAVALPSLFSRQPAAPSNTRANAWNDHLGERSCSGLSTVVCSPTRSFRRPRNLGSLAPACWFLLSRPFSGKYRRRAGRGRRVGGAAHPHRVVLCASAEEDEPCPQEGPVGRLNPSPFSWSVESKLCWPFFLVWICRVWST